jgi:hypothetical protein
MSYQAIGLGAEPDDGTGDSLRIGADKVNDNFVELYTLFGDASDLSSGISATATVVTLTNPAITGPTISGVVGGTQTSATITTLTSTTITGLSTLAVGNISFASGSITDSSGAISFGNENLTTTGTFNCSDITATGTLVFADGSIAIVDLDIDGGTDIGAAVVAADLFIVDDGAGGTNRKTAASRIKTFVEASTVAVTGNITATGTIEPAGDTSASDNAAIGYTSAEGLILTGQGSTSDITIKNDADADVITIATGTTNVDVVGDLTAKTLNVDDDTAAGDNAAIGYTSAEGLILTGQGSTSDITIKNDADATVISVATGTTSVTSTGTWNFSDQVVSKPILKDYGETHSAIGGTGGGTQDFELENGNVISATVDTSANTFTFSNPTTSANGCSFTLILKNGGSQTVNWPGSVDWADGTAPSLTSSGTDILTFLTIDGGTIWHGFFASEDSK